MQSIKLQPENKWFALEITAKLECSEAIEFGLNELDALGTEINNLGKKDAKTLTIVGYFNVKPDTETLVNQLDIAMRIYGFTSDSLEKIEWHEVENQDWLAEWKKHWQPTVTNKFIIAPPWEIVENTNKIIIKIEPSMAFGTGTHETTRLCLKRIEEIYLSEMSFLDVGTGTGILAIAAAKLESRVKSQKSKAETKFTGHSRLSTRHHISGCDTDFDSIKIAKENAELNDAGEIEFYVGSIDENTPKFDFVCANLTADVIVPILPLLVEKFNKFLVLSGILKDQEDLVVSELKKLNVGNHKIEQDGEWISIEIRGING
jgi:ribosomal protein L11 methylase PrmA